MGTLLMATIFALALAIFMCPSAMQLPIIVSPQVAAVWAVITGFIASAAPWVALAAAFLAVVLLGFWVRLCNPDWCYDWMVLLWQVSISMGVVFIYFGMCPACLYLLIIGIPLFALGVILFFVWIATCQPSLCKIFFEIGNLSVIEILIGWIQIILGACVWLYGTWFMLAWTTLLFLLGWGGTVIFCLAAPPND